MLAITYEKETNSVYQHFGDTEYFYLLDEKSNEVKVVDNGGYSHRELIPYLSSLGVTTIICGGVGTHAIELFKQYSINVIPGISGNVDEIIKAYKEGNLIGDFNAIHTCSH